MGQGRIYSKGLERDPIRNGGTRGQNTGKSAWLYKYWGGYITFLTFYYRIGTKGLM